MKNNTTCSRCGAKETAYDTPAKTFSLFMRGDALDSFQTGKRDCFLCSRCRISFKEWRSNMSFSREGITDFLRQAEKDVPGFKDWRVRMMGLAPV